MGGGAVKLVDRLSDWPAAKVLVAGLGASGFAAADGLFTLGAQITVVDENASASNVDKANLLERLDMAVHLGEGATSVNPADYDLVLASPGWHPSHPLLAAAVAAAVPVWSEVELAWRMLQPDRTVPWLGVTGTNGKTTTVNMLTAMLRADGRRVAEVGNIGRPVMEAVLDETPYDVFVVELSSFQLHWVGALSLHSAAVLNLAPDHLEWYQDAYPDDPYGAYARDKGEIYNRVVKSCVYNVADPRTEALVEAAEVVEGARAIGFTLGIPAPSQIGVVDDLIVDRAFIEQRRDSAIELAKLADVHPFAPHNVTNALAAAALARSLGAHPYAIAAGLQQLQLGDHRIQTIGSAKGVTWVDDSKATNPHAAAASLAAFDKVVWVAGGQAKGTRYEELVREHKDRFRAAILLGVDRQLIADAFAAEAPDVPVKLVDEADPTAAMNCAVFWASQQAQPGDTVLLAPAAASLDMFKGYDDRGQAFTREVKALIGDGGVA
ncbi:MAG: UDP-N-acetylmuramoyl-L-alanine--D-glutamate ligase [Propionibacteriaceae bacterium]|jgi:UDP-N-acetylmuramoylalanine--D-glutamate ligase|nr:UDP-N-acetylmuramoyl-L-alanine--D-glutamate ligase [Propionibacteriaceae bacterium]